jgi:hypothetical protein
VARYSAAAGAERGVIVTLVVLFVAVLAFIAGWLAGRESGAVSERRQSIPALYDEKRRAAELAYREFYRGLDAGRREGAA